MLFNCLHSLLTVFAISTTLILCMQNPNEKLWNFRSLLSSSTEEVLFLMNDDAFMNNICNEVDYQPEIQQNLHNGTKGKSVATQYRDNDINTGTHSGYYTNLILANDIDEEALLKEIIAENKIIRKELNLNIEDIEGNKIELMLIRYKAKRKHRMEMIEAHIMNNIERKKLFNAEKIGAKNRVINLAQIMDSSIFGIELSMLPIPNLLNGSLDQKKLIRQMICSLLELNGSVVEILTKQINTLDIQMANDIYFGAKYRSFLQKLKNFFAFISSCAFDGRMFNLKVYHRFYVTLDRHLSGFGDVEKSLRNSKELLNEWCEMRNFVREIIVKLSEFFNIAARIGIEEMKRAQCG